MVVSGRLGHAGWEGGAEPDSANGSARCGEHGLGHETAYLMPAPRYDRTCMPHSRQAPAKDGRTPSLSGSAAIEAMVARTAPAVLELLKDGTPRGNA
jgi:hypothetical protein